MRWVWLSLLLALAGCQDPGNEAPDFADDSPSAAPAAEVVALNNRGVALMGRFDYAQAASVFEQVVAQAPDWARGRANLAVAILNRQGPGDEAAALALLDLLIAEEQAPLRAHYMAGILNFNAGNSQIALDHFMAVVDADPSDAYARYFAGQCLLQLGQPQQAVDYFARAAAADPYLRSAAYGLFLARQQLRDRDGARSALADYERLEGNPRSRLAEIRYTRMGPRAMALAERPAPVARPLQRPSGALFAASQSLASFDVSVLSASVLQHQSRDLIAVATERGTLLCPLTERCTHALPVGATDSGVTAVAWGDYNNDGLADLYLAGPGPNQLLAAADDGQWLDVTQASGTAGQGDTADVAFLDADHDGDLDLLLAQRSGPSQLLSNNGDGTFRPLEPFTGPLIAARQIAAGDVDGDRDLDLLLIGADPPHQWLLNDRLWQYRPADPPYQQVLDRPLTAATLADLDTDGRPELVALEKGRLLVLALAGVMQVDPIEVMPDAETLWLSDFTGEGGYQALVGSPSGWQLVQIESGETLATGGDRPLAVVHQPGGAALLTLAGRSLSMLPPGPGRWPIMRVAFSGQTDAGQSMRSNASGLGTTFVARSDVGWFAGGIPQPQTAPGQSLQPALLGLAGAPAAALAIDWSDGVFQSELDLATGTVHQIVETQRQLASCPVLFVRQGDQYHFVTDVLGVGGIGFNTGFGQYGEPRPREALLLPAEFEVTGASLGMMIAEPMEESAYIDQVRATAIDVPPGWQILLDERMGTGPPEVTGELVWYRQLAEPVAAQDHAGESVLAAVAARDQVAAPLPPTERQLLGLLTRRQHITLTFAQDLGQWDDPVLILDGWVEYGYSQTSFAAWQQGRNYDAVTLEIFHDGRWQSWLPGFGYPAGMPRAASVPLGQLPAGVRRLRLGTHQQIYFDRLAVVQREAPPHHAATPLTLNTAQLKRIGFPRRSNGPQWQPQYDFSVREPFWDARYPRGRYTNLGEVSELVVAADNALAIVGPGDGLALEFGGPLPPLAAGWTRRWLLNFNGWAKDMDLLTRDGETVGPLPVASVEEDRSEVLHARHNLRFQQGR